MRVAIDKKCISKIKDFTEFDYIYIFEDEPIEDLLKLNIHCVHKDYMDEVDINLSMYDIKCIKEANINDKGWKELPKIKQNKFGIIIPNYNYEEWIDKCLGSIAKQTYKNYEVIFVDDCSTDKSVDNVDKYVDKLSNIKIVQLRQKRLNGGARNEAYLHLSDDVDYIMYIDSDDWLLDENVLKQINRALINNPDVLFIGMSDYKNGKTKECYEPNYKDKYEAIQGWSGSCGKVIKKELATRQECLYNEGTLKEDRNQHRRICIYMNNFELLQKPVYVWNKSNSKSVTTLRTKNILWETSTIRQYADILQLQLEQKGKDAKIDKILQEGTAKAKREAEKTMQNVKKAMKLNYFDK